MDNKKSLVVIIVLALLGIGVVVFSNNKDNKNTSNQDHSGAMTENHSHSDVSQKPVEGVQETNQVTYSGFDVIQKTIRIKKGSTVTWTNEDSAKHDVTPDTETDDFKAGDLFGKGETYSHTFNTVGTFSYHCSPHPYMKGTIEVVE